MFKIENYLWYGYWLMTCLTGCTHVHFPLCIYPKNNGESAHPKALKWGLIGCREQP